MINVTIFRDGEKSIYGFRLSGHAGYAEEGSDIVCSAVTILVFNTINCIELFCDEPFEMEADEKKGGFIEYSLPEMKQGKKNHDVQLLLKVMLHGLTDIENEYSGYISINFEEV